MEWVEVTARTVEEAKEAALDQLGVDEPDAEFEIVETPKGGLFGRLRSEARVRARVLPTTPRPKLERRGRRPARDRSGDGAGGTATRSPRSEGRAGSSAGSDGRSSPDRQRGSRSRPAKPASAGPSQSKQNGDSDVTMTDGSEVDEGALAESFLRGLLDASGASYTLERRQRDDNETTELDVKGDDLGHFIGHRGSTLSAIQELTRTVVQRHGPGPHQRVLVDVADYRKARREALEHFTRQVAEQVLASGKARVLEPMRPPDRKVVHDTVNDIAGVSTLSEGEEPRRRVVITPDATD